MIDHIDILKDGASAIYGSDAVAGVINIFLIHKFRGLEIGGSIGNTNLGASNDAREVEGWIKAGTGDDKTDILIIADFYDRAAIYSRDRNLTSNAQAIPFGGGDSRSSNRPGSILPSLSHAWSLFWILHSLLRHPTHFQTLLPIRSTFPVRTVAITAVPTIRTFGHTISRRSRLRFRRRTARASMAPSPATSATNT